MITEGERLHGQHLFAERWKRESVSRSNIHSENHIAKLSEIFSNIRGGLLVEIGTGSGKASRAIASMLPDCQVIAIDSAESALRLARGWKTPQNVSFIQGDAFELPIASGTVSASWTEGLVEHYPQSWRSMIDEQCRITKTEGLIITSVPNILNLPRTFATIVQGRNYRYYPAGGFLPGSLGDLSRKYQELGILIEKVHGWGITYPAQNMYRWNPKTQEREYPAYTQVFHYLGNIMEEPIGKIDELFDGEISKWIGFEFMLVGRKP